jgi:hypothetical protein
MTKFEHSVECQVRRDFAWKFWTNVDNWAVVDPAVEWAKLEGLFISLTWPIREGEKVGHNSKSCYARPSFG